MPASARPHGDIAFTSTRSIIMLQSHKYDAVHAMIPVRHCDVYHRIQDWRRSKIAEVSEACVLGDAANRPGWHKFNTSAACCTI